MSDEIKVSRAPQAAPRADYQSAESSAQKPSKMPWIVLAAVVVVILVLGVLFRDKLFGAKMNEGAAGKASGYQAVFLTNGQVYFGKIEKMDKEYITLRDIFYLQVVQPLQQGQQQQQQEQPQISLVKLGNELHGPVDEMHINKLQVLFYEDLKNDGRVVEAILAYKANPEGQAAAPAAQQQVPAQQAPQAAQQQGIIQQQGQ